MSTRSLQSGKMFLLQETHWKTEQEKFIRSQWDLNVLLRETILEAEAWLYCLKITLSIKFTV